LNEQELMHVIDVHLAERGWPAATLHPGGAICFQVSESAFAAARVRPLSRVEVFASPGYVDGRIMQVLADDRDERIFKGDEGLFISLLTWREGDADWRAEVSLEDGMVVLGRTAHAPQSTGPWVESLESFVRNCSDWTACLSPVQVTFSAPLGDPGVDGGALAELIFRILQSDFTRALP